MRSSEAITAKANSLSSKLKDTARNRGIDSQHLLKRYALERFLSRLMSGPNASLLTLKGGMVMPLLTGDFARPTEDIDASAEAEMTPDELALFIGGVCVTDPAEEDGLVFDPASVVVTPIREGLLPGARVVLSGMLATHPRPTPLRIKVDMCYGDIMLPEPVFRTLPLSLPGFEPVTLPCYHWATVTSEKLHAIYRHGPDNTRMKDFLDLVSLSRTESHVGEELTAALRGTFTAWGGEIKENPPGLSEGFAVSGQRLWTAFVKSPAGKTASSPDFRDVVSEIRFFLTPVIEATVRGEPLLSDWTPGGGWQPALSPSAAPR